MREFIYSQKEKWQIVKKIIFAISFFLPSMLLAADLSVSPAVGTYKVGDRIVVRVLVSGDVSLNAISGVLNIPTSHFTIESISKNASVLNFWVTEPSFSKGSGTARFEGVALSGFKGVGGTVVTLTLRAVKTGQSQITVQSGQILANDGQGSDITGPLNGATYSIEEAPEVKERPVQSVTAPEEKPVAVIPTLRAPVIIQGAVKSQKVIIGASDYQNVKVLLTFLAEDGSKIFITGDSREDGSFTLNVPKLIKRGYYSVSAVMVKDDGSQSEVSNIILLKVGSVFSDVGWEFWVFFGLLCLMIIYLIIRLHHLALLYRKKRRVNTDELKEAREVLHSSFDILHEDVQVHSAHSLSVTQKKQLSQLEKDLDSAEKIIDKEIRDIESS